MANYVWHRVICTEEILNQYFLDPVPFVDGIQQNPPYITFRKLFGYKSAKEYWHSDHILVYNGFGFSWQLIEKNRVEVKFCTKWQYPIHAILKAFELCREELQWFACEENHVYVSRFTWSEQSVKEHFILLPDSYWGWDEKIEQESNGKLPDWDDPVWSYLPQSGLNWHLWTEGDIFSRYNNQAVCKITPPHNR